MKRFQKVSAFLMALVLIVSLLPAGVLPAVALDSQQNGTVTPSVGDGKTYLHAVYVSDGVTLNGVHDYTYPLNVALTSDMMIGAAWDLEYLYLAVNSAEAFTQLKVNGVAVVASEVTAAAGTDLGFAEYRISLYEAGIKSLASGVNKVTVQLGEEDAQTLYLIFDNNNYARQKLASNNTSSATYIDFVDNYTAKFVKSSGLALYNGNDEDALKGDLHNAAVVELDLDIDQVFYNSSTSSNVLSTLRTVGYGINVQVVDEYCTKNGTNIDELFKFGFVRYNNTTDDNGALYFRHAFIENGEYKSEDVRVADTDNRLVHVRAEYSYAADGNGEISHDSVVSVKYFINGVFLAEATNVRIAASDHGETGHLGTGAYSVVRVLANYVDSTKTNYSVLTSSNYSVSYGDTAELSQLQAVLDVKNQIDAIGTVTLDSKTDIEAAEAAYAALPDAQKDLVTNYAILTAARAEYNELKAAADKLAQDKAAAKAVDDQITAIGTVTYSKAAAIATVRNAYDALTPDQKDLVENLNTLTAAEAEIAQLQAQIDAVEAKIAAIGEVTLSDAEAIAQAKAAFDALAADQQLAVENAAALTAAETALKALQDAVAEVIAKIDAIGTVTLESKADIDAAEAAYTALNAEQKALVTNYNVLTAAKKAYEELKAAADQAEIDQAAANGVKDLINAIGTVTLNSKSAIEAAEAAYAALTDAQKDLVTNYATLTAARAEYDRLVAEKEAADNKAAADAVIAKIAAIGTVTLNSKTAIEDAEAAYAALTDTQKALVTNYSALTAARAAYDQQVAEKEAADKAAADKAAADAAIAKIEAIGTVTLESKLAIEAARVAYNALTPEQKAMVSAQILLKLTNAETALKALETPEEPPKTGDTTMIAPVMLLLGLSVAGLAVVLTGKKRFF